MATKNISITLDAYKRLAALRKKNESFSEIIMEITGKKDIMNFFGCLSEDSADRIEKSIIKNRKRDAQMQKVRESQLWRD
jgi:predicted CopG family antitoxin